MFSITNAILPTNLDCVLNFCLKFAVLLYF